MSGGKLSISIENTDLFGDGWLRLAVLPILQQVIPIEMFCIRHDGPGIPEQMSDNSYLRLLRQYIFSHCKKLMEYGLLKHLGSGVCVITERGERYLDGEIKTSADRLDEPLELDGGEN